MDAIAIIVETVAEHFGLAPDRLMHDPTRSHAVSHPRQIAMALSRELTRHSLPGLGARFGRDHTTVLYATRKIAALCERDPDFAAELETIRGEIAAAKERHQARVGETFARHDAIRAAERPAGANAALTRSF